MSSRIVRRSARRPGLSCCRGRVQRRGGFTLIEVLLVLAIIVALGGVVAVSVFSMQDKADAQTAKTQLSGLENAIKLYRIDMKVLPDRLEDLVMQPSNLPPGKTWQPYFDRQIPLDPWNQQYVYEKIDNRTFNLYSLGPDGAQGTDDDIHYNR